MSVYKNTSRAQSNGSQREVPTFTVTGSSVRVGGYQPFTIDALGVRYQGQYTRKFNAINDFLKLRDLKTSVMDIGCSNGLCSFMAAKLGYDRVYAIDHDVECLQLIDNVQKMLQLDTIDTREFSFGNVVDEQADVVIACALIHWVYSCTSLFGSLDAIIEYLAALTTNTLIIEWVSPEDHAIRTFKHTSFNKEVIKEPYTKENFLKALSTHFSSYHLLCPSCATREVWVAQK